MIGIRKTTRGPLPRIPFEKMARAVLGARFELSLVVCGDALAQAMNIKYRKRSYRPNVLSFPISEHEGEIFLNVPAAQREAHRYGIPARDRIAHLFVHGCYHLAGLDHGPRMEREEARILKKFGFAEPL